jgi:hypothetical protein
VLIQMTDVSQLDERRLMDLYAESNLENTAFFCPDVSDRQAAVRQVEAGYLTFLREDFFYKRRKCLLGVRRKWSLGKCPENQPNST